MKTWLLLSLVFVFLLTGLHTAGPEGDPAYDCTDCIHRCFKSAIAVRPGNPVTHWYYAQYYLEQREWQDAVFHLKNRLYALLDGKIVREVYRLEKMEGKLEKIRDIKWKMNEIRWNKHVTQKQQEELLAVARHKLTQYEPEAVLRTKADIKKAVIPGLVELAEHGIPCKDDRIKRPIFTAYMEIAEAYYNLAQANRGCIVSRDISEECKIGMNYLKKASRLLPEDPEPYSWQAEFYRLQVIQIPLNQEELIHKWDRCLEISNALRKKQERRQRVTLPR